MMPLLSSQERKNMLEYKYSGGDSSPVYQYILSPFAQVLVDNMIPMWMAPNVVTLIGLCASVLSMIVTLLWNPQLNENGPHWLHLLNALCVFAYQTFDNMDGKQARRTGTSSPLGMLFDHGCDALNAGIICIPMASVAATGWTTKFYMCLWSGFLPFYFQAWEEYYTGSMVLPPFNGPTEGLLIAIGMCCLSYIFGAHYWHQSVFQLSPEWSVLGIPIVDGACDITPYFMAFSFTTTVSSIIALKQIYTVIVHVLRSGNSQQSVGKALLDLLPFLVFFPTILYWCAVSDIALSWYPLVTMLLISCTFVEMLVHIMIAHICATEMKPLERYGAYLAVMLPLAVNSSHEYAEISILFALAAFQTLLMVIMLYRVCTEMADELGIYIFIQGKRQKRKGL